MVNLAGLIESHPAEHMALVAGDATVSYGELRQRVGRLRGGLAELGVVPGDRVALLAGTSVRFVEAFLAVVGLGAVAVPLNPLSPVPELERELAGVGVSAVIIDRSGTASFAGVRAERVPTLVHVIGADDELDAEPVALADVGPDDAAVLEYTSGTAGAPRAAVLTHANLTSNIAQALGSRDHLTPADLVLGVLPLHHIFGLTVVVGTTLTAGASVVLADRFEPAATLALIARRGITVVPGAPPMWMAWAHMPAASPDAFATVRHALSGAAKLPESTWSALAARYQLPVREGYGLTEASPVVTTQVGIEPRRGSIGKALDGVEVRLVDGDGDDVLLGDAGEVWVRGPNVFPGYWEDAQATAAVLTPDGWLRTGDIAVADDDGYLFLVDRVKDLVIVSGFNVYPAEVEEVVASLPGVADVAVVGVPHPHTGEAVKAIVVLEPGVALDAATVIAYCRDHLARYKCPSEVVFAAELPRGASGKILRRVLR